MDPQLYRFEKNLERFKVNGMLEAYHMLNVIPESRVPNKATLLEEIGIYLSLVEADTLFHAPHVSWDENGRSVSHFLSPAYSRYFDDAEAREDIDNYLMHQIARLPSTLVEDRGGSVLLSNYMRNPANRDHHRMWNELINISSKYTKQTLEALADHIYPGDPGDLKGHGDIAIQQSLAAVSQRTHRRYKGFVIRQLKVLNSEYH